MFSTLLAGAGFSFASGLNAYLPLLILALADRLSTSFDLEHPYHWVSSNAGIFVVLIVLPVELLADKIPRLDHYNDFVHTAIRPLVGGFCFMAVASASGEINPWIAGFMGLVVAGSVHRVKMRSRTGITLATRGLGNPFASVLEDVVAVVVAILSATVPLANIAALPMGAALILRSYRRMASGQSRLLRAFQPRQRP